LYFQVASGNVVDDQTHCATWDLLCQGRRIKMRVSGRLGTCL